MDAVRVRFAPSPTGYLHIGGARTALYDWLLARKTGGQFILRIEDTDRNRYVADAVQDIKDSLRWLGLDWDEGPDAGGEVGPYFQSERLNIYQKYATQLVEAGKAYYCFCTPERLEEMRKKQEQAGEPSGYDRHCRELSAEEVEKKLAAGQKYVIRFKVPLTGKTQVHDELRGEMVFDHQTLDDFVVLKSDGFPTYHLASVVDDHLMGISHVIRGEEWIISLPRHFLLYAAFGWTPPAFVHLPIFLAPDGKGKLSKRHGATGVHEFKEKGYLPEALVNFLLLLGWHPATDQELFTLDQAVEAFSVERINTSPVNFSLDKLDWFNGIYIRQLSHEELAKRALPFLQKDGLLPDPCPPEQFAYLVRLMPLVQERIKLLSDISDAVGYFLREEIDPPAPELLLGKKGTVEQVTAILAKVETVLSQTADFSEENLERTLRALAEELQIKAGQLFMPVRVAVTGQTATPGLFQLLAALGQKKVLPRLKQAVAVLQQTGMEGAST
ncbi:MAG TPA: glutamate--tRNA ligase [Hydrogenispora sp.]|jgi:glutamyl-tRNA synthetase|nr:glutamate--tRNA ligase [Hydrogenispora sp.]